jgi:hypothetical protein
MRSHPVPKTRRLSRGREGMRQHALVERPVPAPVGEQPVSSISLFDGLPITEFDVLPASASRLL